MAQERRGKLMPAEDAQFKRMVTNISCLYLGLEVLLLVDLPYHSRFWTLFEAWLSMQKPSTSGLTPAPLSKRRAHIRWVRDVDKAFVDERWATRTPELMYELLSSAEVVVSNKRD